MNIDNLTIPELKALGYDTIQKITVEQNNLSLINKMIQKKQESTGPIDTPPSTDTPPPAEGGQA